MRQQPAGTAIGPDLDAHDALIEADGCSENQRQQDVGIYQRVSGPLLKTVLAMDQVCTKKGSRRVCSVNWPSCLPALTLEMKASPLSPGACGDPLDVARRKA